MSRRKERLTVTVDPELVRAGEEAVGAGQAESLSSWVNAALADRAARDRRLRALSEAVADYEAEFGTISEHELAAVREADRQGSCIVRGRLPATPTKKTR
jgi:Arc/MetJ-type ribon-helix-helix transcriptional regulator